MGCISNINGSIQYDCLTGAVGIAELILINYSDVQSVAINSGLATVTLTGSATPVRVVSMRRGANATEAVRVNENAPNALEQAVNFTVYQKTNVQSDFINRLVNARVVAVAKMIENGVYRVYGCNYGLELSELTESANENGGYTSVTLSTPDSVYGEARANITASTWNTISGRAS